jgi:pantoate--beta-alanine ligase
MSDAFVVSSSVDDVRRIVAEARSAGKRIGCVPTMGALHAGHVSLFEVARRTSDFLVATIFVNPTQFAPHEDLAKYPRPLADDLTAARNAGVALVFTPTPETIYPAGYSTYVSVEGVSAPMEGVIRPTHFRGVATVVLKLFNIVQPDVAVFGAKDYQQQALIRRMVADLNVPVEIVTAPTIREPDGLAMSSRNVYLSTKERKSALALSQALTFAESRLRAGTESPSTIREAMLELMRSTPLVQPDYAVIADPVALAPVDRRQREMVVLVAAKVGVTRLIDNREVRLESLPA